MPFTPAHTAILFPARWFNPAYISWTALIIGSMVPDAEYFLWMNSGSYISHTFWGIFVFNLPLTFLIAMLWHSFLSKSLLPKIPFLKNKFKKSYIPDFPKWLAKNYFKFIFSALVGIFSHLFWDSFCHAEGAMTRRLPILIDYANILGYKVRWCYVAWYISTIIGLITIFFIIIDRKALFDFKQWGANIRFYWAKVLIVACALAFIRILLGLNQNVPRHLIIISISGFLYGILIVSYFDRNKRLIN